MIRFFVNVDHVATLRNARGEGHPDPVCAALFAVRSGADGITAHLREDRRHIKDQDIQNLKNKINAPLNMEMAPIDEMVEIALRVRPAASMLVPEKREELTTEGGLNVAADYNRLASLLKSLSAANIKTTLFVDPDPHQIEAAAQMDAHSVELHTGAYCRAHHAGQSEEAKQQEQLLREAALLGHQLGLEIHAGHALSLATLPQIARLPHLAEVSIGHFIFGEAIFAGLADIISKMKAMLTV